MTPEEKTVFAHHDAIAGARCGEILMVCDPVKAQVMFDGHMVDMQPGQSVRVKFAAGGLWCEAVIDETIRTVVIKNSDFGCLERTGERKVKVR